MSNRIIYEAAFKSESDVFHEVDKAARHVYRQGDVLFVAVASVPKGKRMSRKDGRLIVAEGESTGHAHAIKDVHVQMIEATDMRYLKASKAFEVVHEEHAPVTLPKGNYQIVYQHQHTPQGNRRVLD